MLRRNATLMVTSGVRSRDIWVFIPHRSQLMTAPAGSLISVTLWNTETLAHIHLTTTSLAKMKLNGTLPEWPLVRVALFTNASFARPFHNNLGQAAMVCIKSNSTTINLTEIGNRGARFSSIQETTASWSISCITVTMDLRHWTKNLPMVLSQDKRTTCFLHSAHSSLQSE